MAKKKKRRSGTGRGRSGPTTMVSTLPSRSTTYAPVTSPDYFRMALIFLAALIIPGAAILLIFSMDTRDPEVRSSSGAPLFDLDKRVPVINTKVSHILIGIVIAVFSMWLGDKLYEYVRKTRGETDTDEPVEEMGEKAVGGLKNFMKNPREATEEEKEEFQDWSNKTGRFLMKKAKQENNWKEMDPELKKLTEKAAKGVELTEEELGKIQAWSEQTAKAMAEASSNLTEEEREFLEANGYVDLDDNSFHVNDENAGEQPGEDQPPIQDGQRRSFWGRFIPRWIRKRGRGRKFSKIHADNNAE